MSMQSKLGSAIKFFTKNKTRVIILAVVVVGMSALIVTSAATFFISSEAESGTRSGASLISDSNASGGQAIRFGAPSDSACGQRVQDYDYQVPFGNAAWNVPLCNLPRHQHSEDYAQRFTRYSRLTDDTPEDREKVSILRVGFGLGDPNSTFGRSVYYAKDATTTKQVRLCTNPSAGCVDSNLDGGNLPAGDIRRVLPERRVPWNPEWAAPSGGDNELLILDDETGELISFHGLIIDPIQAIGRCGPLFSERLCATNIKILRDHEGNLADYRTFEGSTGDRGGGISYYAGLVTPDEVAAGEIRHALGISIMNSATGPHCTPAQRGTSAEGRDCGTALAPAAKFEWGFVNSFAERFPRYQGTIYEQIYTQDKLIPEGMRFGLDITPEDIDAWIQSKPDLRDNPRKAETARIFATALMDYGMVVLDTNGGGISIQTSIGINKSVRQQWADLGITDSKDTWFLDGLMTHDNVFVVEPPVNQCVDGTQSKYYCRFTKSVYPNQ